MWCSWRLERRRCGLRGRRRSSRLALLGQSRSPVLRGQDPRPPHRPRLCGLVPIGTEPHRRGLRVEVRLTPQSSSLSFESPKQLLPLSLAHPHEGPGRSIAQDLRQRHLGKSKRHTRVRDVSKSRPAARYGASRLQPDACVRMKSVLAAVEEPRCARRVETWPVDLRSSGISVIILGGHMCVGHCLRRLRSQKTTEETRNSSAEGLRQDLYRPPRLPSAACGWRLGTVAVWRRLQCAVGQGNRRQISGNAGCCRRDARRERESASRSFARSFTGRILYSLSVSFSLNVTRMRSLRPLRRDSPNGEPSEVSSALPGQRNEADVLVGRIGTDSTSRRRSVSGVSVANAVEGTFCAV